MAEITDESKKIITAAQHLLQIVPVGMHIDKNMGAKLSKFQINRLLAPKWGLPISNRGTTILSKDEVNAIFVEDDDSHFSVINKIRVKRMEPPFPSHAAARQTMPDANGSKGKKSKINRPQDITPTLLDFLE